MLNDRVNNTQIFQDELKCKDSHIFTFKRVKNVILRYEDNK